MLASGRTTSEPFLFQTCIFNRIKIACVAFMQNAYLHGNQCNSWCMETMLFASEDKRLRLPEIPFIFPAMECSRYQTHLMQFLHWTAGSDSLKFATYFFLLRLLFVHPLDCSILISFKRFTANFYIRPNILRIFSSDDKWVNRCERTTMGSWNLVISHWFFTEKVLYESSHLYGIAVICERIRPPAAIDTMRWIAFIRVVGFLLIQ